MKHLLLSILLGLTFSTMAVGQTPVRATNQLVNAQTGATYAIDNNDDAGKLITACNVGAQAYSIAQAGTADLFQTGWFADIKNICAGVVTITPTVSTVDGAATLVLTEGQSARIVSNGTNYRTGLVGSLGAAGITNSAPANTVPSTADGDGNLDASQLTDDGRALAGAAAVPATVNLTLAVNPTIGDTMSIGSRNYEFVAEASPLTLGEIRVGATLANTKTYFLQNLSVPVGFRNPDFTASSFVGDVTTLTARAIGTAGNAISVSGTFTSGSNLFSAAETSGGVDEVGYLAVGPNPAPQGPIRLGYGQPLTSADSSDETRRVIQFGDDNGDDVVIISTPAMPDDQELLMAFKSSNGGETVFDFSSDGDADWRLFEINGAQFRWSSVDDAGVEHQLVSIDADSFKVSNYSGGNAFNIKTNGSDMQIGVAKIFLNATVTAAGTTTVQEINKSAGAVNLAAAESSKAVTNSTVTASSIIIANAATNDSVCAVKNVVAGSGTFTITMTGACNAECRVNWWVITPQ